MTQTSETPIGTDDLFNPTTRRRDSFNSKWSRLEAFGGVSPDEGIAMWVADSDYRCPPVVLEALHAEVAYGMLGYGYDDPAYRAAVQWWLGTRHGWQIDPDWIVTTQGLGLAIATILDLWSAPGEGVCFFTPVYHEFRLKTERAGRRPVELPMRLEDGRYVLDFEAASARITEDTRILLWCNPQNPSGRVWTPEEQRQVADFAERHNLLLVSDEVHCDLVFPGSTHVPMDIAAPEHRARTITLFAASKTFNLAGLRVGQAIIPDPELRQAYQQRLIALNYDAATLGVTATRAAFSPEGAAWADAQLRHLDGNIRLFNEGMAAIPGVWSMPLQATYLAWVDFSRLGMTEDEILRRVRDDAKVVPQFGRNFCAETALWHRFNLAMPRAQVAEAVSRLQAAFADLQ